MILIGRLCFTVIASEVKQSIAAKKRVDCFVASLLARTVLSSERVFPCQYKSSARERVEQEVLLVEEVVDPEIEREICRGIVMALYIAHDGGVESPVDVGHDVGVIQRRILFSAVAGGDGVGPTLVRPMGDA